MYDGDFAGEKASDRGLDIFLEEEVDASIMSLPAGEDPCDFLLSRGAEAFLALTNEAMEVFEFKVAQASKKHDLKTVAGQTRALDEILATVAKVPAVVRQELYLARNNVLRDLSERLAIPESALRERLRGLRTGRAASEVKKDLALPSEEKWLLESLLAEPRLVEAAAARVSPDDLRSVELQIILRAVYEAFQADGDVRLASVVTAAGELGALVVALAESGARQSNHERRAADCMERIAQRRKRETRAQLKRRLVEGAGDKGDEDRILKELQEGF